MENRAFNLDPTDRGGVRPDATKFQRRGSYNFELTNEDVNNPTPYQSLDGRKWTTKDKMFIANQQYYRKMGNNPKDKLANFNDNSMFKNKFNNNNNF